MLHVNASSTFLEGRFNAFNVIKKVRAAFHQALSFFIFYFRNHFANMPLDAKNFTALSCCANCKKGVGHAITLAFRERSNRTVYLYVNRQLKYS